MHSVFQTGDLIEVETCSVRAVARIRESQASGRLHIAFEMGEYLPWVDDVFIRHFGNDRSQATAAKVLHAGTTTALLSVSTAAEAVPDVRKSGLNALGRPRAPYPTLP